ncbi:MAG: ribosomal subunit interface protein [Lacunisphaera sp.]|nr:ribosomal subunit interface protein [Lacunisphaera sp.]
MTIQFNTGNRITGDQRMSEAAAAIVEDNLSHFANQLTRVEVHVDDVNAQKGGSDDIRCSMEARLEGHQPLATEHRAGSVEEAIEGAAAKLKRHLEHTLGRLKDR